MVWRQGPCAEGWARKRGISLVAGLRERSLASSPTRLFFSAGGEDAARGPVLGRSEEDTPGAPSVRIRPREAHARARLVGKPVGGRGGEFCAQNGARFAAGNARGSRGEDTEVCRGRRAPRGTAGSLCAAEAVRATAKGNAAGQREIDPRDWLGAPRQSDTARGLGRKGERRCRRHGGSNRMADGGVRETANGRRTWGGAGQGGRKK